MSGAGNDRHIDRTITLLLSNFDLANGPILVVGALYDRHRYADIGEVFRDVPLAKRRIEPSAIPTIEGVVDIAMPARQFGPEIGGLINRFDGGDRGHRNIFDDEMRRDHHNPADAMVAGATRVNRRDRGA